MLGRVWLPCLVLAGLFLAHGALAQVAVPPLAARVTDLTGTLTTSARETLEQTLAAFEAEEGAQIAILLVPTTRPETIEQFSIRVADAWKIGRAEPDDGVIVIVALEDRTLRIEVGYGLEGAIPDAMARRIIDEAMVPRFREGDYFGGLVAAVDRLAGLIRGEPLPAPGPGPSPAPGIGDVWPIVLMGAVIGGGLLRRALGPLGGAAVTSLVVGVLVWIIVSAASIALLAALFAFVFTLAGGGGGGRGWHSSSRGRRGGWTSAGMPGGGWGGRGGGFGGGGASGRW